jgi:DNA-binding winged helix-turn-helix (wHTH) protein
MKTVFKDGAYQRVSNELGESMVRRQGYKYVSKSEWKTNVRGPIQAQLNAQQQEENAKKAETLSKKAEKRQKIKAKQRPIEAADKLLK